MASCCLLPTRSVYQVCHGVGCCVKDGSCFSSTLECDIQWIVLMEYLTISTNVRRYQTHYQWHFLSWRQRIGAHALCMQQNPTDAALLTSFLLNHAPPWTAPRWTRWLQDLGSHTAAWVWVMSQKRLKKPNGNLLIQHLSEKNVIYVFPRFAR